MSTIFISRLTALLPLALLTYTQPAGYIPTESRLTTYSLLHLRVSPVICIADLIVLLDCIIHASRQRVIHTIRYGQAAPTKLQAIATAIVGTRYGWDLPDKFVDDWGDAVFRQLTQAEEGRREWETRMTRVAEEWKKYAGDSMARRLVIASLAGFGMWRVAKTASMDGGWVGALEMAAAVAWVLDWLVNEVILALGLRVWMSSSNSEPNVLKEKQWVEKTEEEEEQATTSVDEGFCPMPSSPPISLLARPRPAWHQFLLLVSQVLHHAIPACLFYPLYSAATFSTMISHCTALFAFAAPVFAEQQNADNQHHRTPQYNIFRHQHVGLQLLTSSSPGLAILPLSYLFADLFLGARGKRRFGVLGWYAILLIAVPTVVAAAPYILTWELFFAALIVMSIISFMLIMLYGAVAPAIMVMAARTAASLGLGRKLEMRRFSWWWDVAILPGDGRIWALEVAVELVMACWVLERLGRGSQSEGAH